MTKHVLLNACLDSMTDAVSIYTAVRDDSGRIVDFRIEYVNPVACKLTQMSKEDQEGRLLCELFPAHKEIGLFGEYCRVVETGAPLRKIGYACELPHADGKHLRTSFDLYVSPVEDGVITSRWNVTEEVNQSNCTEQKASQIADLVRNSSEGIVVVDAEGLVLFANPAAEALLGRRSAGAVGYHLGYPAAGGEPSVVTFPRSKGEATVVEMRAMETRWEGELAFVVNLHDITETKQAFDQAQRLAAIVQSTHDAVLSITLDGTITSWNAAAERMYGCSAQDAVGLNISMLVPAERNDEASAILERIRSGKEIESYETVHHTSDGKQLHVALTVSPLHNESGRIIGASTIARDVTEQHRARLEIEQKTVELERAKTMAEHAATQLQKTQNDLELAQAVAQVGSWHIDLLKNQFFWSTESYHIFRMTPGTPLTYQNFMERVHPDDRELVDESWQAALTGKPYDIEHRLMIDGEVKWVRVKADLEFDPDGSPNGGIGICQDITDRKQSEIELFNSQARTQRLNRILRAIRNINQLIVREKNLSRLIREACEMLVSTRGFDACWIVLADGDGNVFDSAQTQFGEKQMELLLHLINQGHLPQCFRRAKEHSPVVSYGLQHDCSSCPLIGYHPEETALTASLRHGKKFYGLITIYLPRSLTEEAEELGLIQEVAEDLAFAFYSMETERKQHSMEKQLQQAQKMEAIGTLAGGIAHDFNNILGIILGYVELVLLTINRDSESYPHLQEVRRAARRATDLVRQILAFSRRSDSERRPLQVVPIVKECMKLLRATLPSTIEIQQKIDVAQGGDMVLADPTQIHQVLMNLCGNSAYAMREHGGTLEVSLADIVLQDEDALTVSELMPGAYLKITVKDTGQGIDPAFLNRIFDPYFTTKEQGHGTGLGLSVVHGIVKSYEGAISVRSEPWKGATFEVLLPRVESKPDIESENSPVLLRGSESILFVDDEEGLVMVTGKMLENLGYQVTSRTSSIEALHAFRAQPHKFDLIITDQTMPQMTGASLAKEILSIRPDIPIILCTGYSEILNLEKAQALGIRELLMKPLVVSQVAETIRQVLDGKKAGKA